MGKFSVFLVELVVCAGCPATTATTAAGIDIKRLNKYLVRGSVDSISVPGTYYTPLSSAGGIAQEGKVQQTINNMRRGQRSMIGCKLAT